MQTKYQSGLAVVTSIVAQIGPSAHLRVWPSLAVAYQRVMGRGNGICQRERAAARPQTQLNVGTELLLNGWISLHIE